MKDVSSVRLNRGLGVGCGFLLLFAILPIPYYGFYLILRWIVCLASLFVAYGFYKSNLSGWMITFIALAVIFNPFLPLYMSKSAWVSIDLISAVLFFVSIKFIK